MEKFKIALIQLNTGEDIRKNNEETSRYVAESAQKGAKLVVLPEHSDAIGKSERKFASPIPGTQSLFYSELAKKFGVYLHCGSMTEKSELDRPYNTSLVFDPSGHQIGLYRKLHMFDINVQNGPSVCESRGVTKGDRISVVQTDLCTLGLSICYDLRFGEIYRIMAAKGAEILIVSANFTENTGRAHWETLVRARAIENGCYVAAVDQCGKKYHFDAWGHTMLVDPWGNIICALEQEPGVLIAEIDIDKVQKVQRELPVLDNLREDIYELKSNHINVYKQRPE